MKAFSAGLILTALTFSLLHPLVSQHGPAASKTRILIALEPTNFKKQLVKKMVASLNDGTRYIKVIDHQKGQLSTEAAGDYSAVFITGSGVKSMVRPWIVEWISNQTRTNNIILHTTQKFDWTVPIRVDSVTSASDQKALQDLSQQYAEKVKNLLPK